MHNQNNSHAAGAEDMVTIPLSEYTELVRKDTLLQIILNSKNMKSWEVAAVVTAVHSTLFPDALAESGDDPDA